MRILAIGGVPGVGKSFLMNRIISKLGPGVKERLGLLDYIDFESTFVLGKYEIGDNFPGTDKLSMSVQADAEEFLRTFNFHKSIAFEGDRLVTGAFLAKCRQAGELRFISLQVDFDTLKSRRATRSSNAGKAQNATWLKGRESKAYNLTVDLDAEIRRVDTDVKAEDLAYELVDWLKGHGVTPVVESGRLF